MEDSGMTDKQFSGYADKVLALARLAKDALDAGRVEDAREVLGEMIDSLERDSA